MNKYLVATAVSFVAGTILVGCDDETHDYLHKPSEEVAEDPSSSESAEPDVNSGDTPVQQNRTCNEGETKNVSENNCTTTYICLNDSWMATGLPQCETATSRICVEGGTTALVENNCIVNYICQNNSWVVIGAPQCISAPTPVTSSASTPTSTPAPVSSASTTPTTNPTPVSTGYTCPKSVMFCAATSVYGRVETGADDGSDTYGWFFSYTDDYSSFSWPAGVNLYDDLDAAQSCSKYGSIKGSVNISKSAKNPYGVLAFNIAGDSEVSSTDITSWNGLCVAYKSTKAFDFEVQPVNDEVMTGYNQPHVTLNASSSIKVEDFSWSNFQQAEGWGEPVSTSTVLKNARAIRFQFKESASFEIFAIGKKGTCK